MAESHTPATARQPPPKLRLMLFVAGEEHNSRIARVNLARICKEILNGRCEMQVVDVMQDFETALEYGIVLTPALLVVEPLPQIVIVGDLSDTEEVLTALQVGR